jgi:hypothetical protein
MSSSSFCKMIVSYAPARLLKLQFKRVESQLRSEIKKADAEISEELLALAQNKNATELVKRHEAKFRRTNFYPACEACLESLRALIEELRSIKPEDAAHMQEVFDHVQTYWFNLTQRIESVYGKLTMLPDAKENFQFNLVEVDNWLNEAEVNAINLFSNSMASTTEYKNVLEKIKVRARNTFNIDILLYVISEYTWNC